MAYYKMFSTGLVLALSGMCLCQSPQPNSPSQYKQQQSFPQFSYQNGPAAQPQTRLEDIEREYSTAKPQQAFSKTQESAAPSAFRAQPQPQPQQQPSSQILAYPQPQYYIQPYQGQQQQQFLAQQYSMAFDVPGVQYMFINPAAYNPQAFQQYYVQVPQPSAIPEYITKQSTPSALPPSTPSPLNKQAPVEYKPQFVVNGPSLANFKQENVAAAPADLAANFKQQQQQGQFLDNSAPAFQFVQQPQAAAPPSEFAYITRHPTTPQVKSASAPSVQQQIQYTATPQQYQQPQFYVNVPSIPQQPIVTYNSAAPVEPARIQPSLKSEFSSGIKSTTALPTKTSEFAYKFESTPSQQQQQPQQANNGAYSTLRFSN